MITTKDLYQSIKENMTDFDSLFCHFLVNFVTAQYTSRMRYIKTMRPLCQETITSSGGCIETFSDFMLIYKSFENLKDPDHHRMGYVICPKVNPKSQYFIIFDPEITNGRRDELVIMRDSPYEELKQYKL